MEADFLNVHSAQPQLASSSMFLTPQAGPRSKCLGGWGPCGMFSIQATEDSSPAISKNQSDFVLDELG